MSVSKWAYEADKCDGEPCVGDCDLCSKSENDEYMILDLKSAEWLVYKMQNDVSVFPIEFEECEKCGAMYLPQIEHDCNKTIKVIAHKMENDE